jgi:hypothetical protein
MAAAFVLLGASLTAWSTSPQATRPATSATAGTTTTSPRPTPVPTAYRPLASILGARVADLRARAARGRLHATPVAAAELLNANGNLGPALLAPQAITTVNTVLDRFQALHVKGVTVEIGFPMLAPSFVNSSGYLAFYEQVAAAVHRRGMQLDVEENPAFPGFTSLAVSYSGLTLAGYAAEQAQEAQTIIDHLAPTYLTILDETDTFALHLHLPLDNPSAAVQVVNLELAGLRRRHTKVGAGTGTWMGAAIDQALVTQTSIDYVSVHVYPIDAQSLDNLDEAAVVAASAHKPIVMDEAWLYKVPTAGIGTALIHEQSTVRDAFSFFAPLDQQFLTALDAYGRTHGVRYLSPFWTGQFFAYLDWTPPLDVETPAAVRAESAAAASRAVRAGRFSTTGRAYAALAR